MSAHNVLFISTDHEMYSKLNILMDEYEVVYALQLEDGLRQFNSREYLLVIIDLELVKADREVLLNALRRAHSVPIIALSNFESDEDIARVLRSGADVHLKKPVSAVILEAQAQALIDRYTMFNFSDRSVTDDGLLFRCGDFCIDFPHHCILLGDSPLKLSAREFELLSYFLRNANRVITESQIYERVLRTDKDFHSGLYTPISRLRQKIEPNPQNPVYLRTVRNIGYCFCPRYVELCDNC